MNGIFCIAAFSTSALVIVLIVITALQYTHLLFCGIFTEKMYEDAIENQNDRKNR